VGKRGGGREGRRRGLHDRCALEEGQGGKEEAFMTAML